MNRSELARSGEWAYLSSMTSFRTFIMATDWSSVKPSLCSRCTNLSVSKWWSRCRIAVAWNARRRMGLCAREARRSFADDSTWNWAKEPGVRFVGWRAARGRAAWRAEPVVRQLKRGKRNRGSISAAMMLGVAILAVQRLMLWRWRAGDVAQCVVVSCLGPCVDSGRIRTMSALDQGQSVT